MEPRRRPLIRNLTLSVHEPCPVVADSTAPSTSRMLAMSGGTSVHVTSYTDVPFALSTKSSRPTWALSRIAVTVPSWPPVTPT